jgi:hypothetical protein
MFRHKIAAAAMILGLSCAGTTAAAAAPNPPTGPIESKYDANGPATAVHMTSSTACDRKGNVCEIWYPSDIARGRPRAVLLWANGTSDVPVGREVYDYLLSHFASWGFVVIATRDGKTGYGDTVLDSLAYLRSQASSPGSPLFRRVNFGRVGVGGHSQGATGAVNAMLKSNGAIRTSIAFQLPAQLWCSPADLCLLTPDLKAATSGSIFYVGGTLDALISPDWQLGNNPLNSLTAYYNATPPGLMKAKGLVKLANHNDILGKPDCGSAALSVTLTCTFGVYGYRGYPTAWLAWQLQGSAEAGAAFRSRTGEFFSANAWHSQLSNVP